MNFLPWWTDSYGEFCGPYLLIAILLFNTFQLSVVGHVPATNPGREVQYDAYDYVNKTPSQKPVTSILVVGSIAHAALKKQTIILVVAYDEHRNREPIASI